MFSVLLCRLSFLGNDTIDPYPLFAEVELEKIKIIKQETFEILREEFRRFKEFFRQERQDPQPLSSQPVVQRSASIPKTIRKTLEYQPSNIIYVRESEPWRWRRVSEWFKDCWQYQNL